MATVKLARELRDWQKEVLATKARFLVLICHRRSWKTVIALLKLLKSWLATPWLYAYISPYYRQSKAIAWDILKKMVRGIEGTKINESELKVVFPNWAVIRLFWADNPDSLRWLDIQWCVFDEVDQQPTIIYSEIVAPMLIANHGWAMFIWTPKGKGHLYKSLKRYEKSEDWYTLTLKASDSWLLTPEQLNEARRQCDTEDIFEQEYECSFDAAIQWAYYKKELSECRRDWRIKPGLYDSVLEVYTVWDLWISDYMAIGFIQVHWWHLRFIDAYQSNWEGFEHYKEILNERGYKYAGHYFPHDIKVRELTSWQSRLETVRHMFWDDKVHVLPQLKIMDWIQAARKHFSKFFFDEDKCEQLLEYIALYRQKYDETRWIFLNTPEHDHTSHMADVLRYSAVAYDNLTTNVNSWEAQYQDALNSYLS